MNAKDSEAILQPQALYLASVYDMIHLLTAIGLTAGGSSTVHIYTQTTQNNTMKQNTQNRTCITIRTHKHNNKYI